MQVVDLFSGTGAATKAFKDRGHEVITVDIDPKLKPDIVADVRYLPLRGLKPDFVWASPPCGEFSALNREARERFRAGGWPEHGFETLAAACDAIATLNPTYWAIENVRGAARWWGRPTKRVGKGGNAPWLLWGHFPPFDTGVLRKGFICVGENRKPPGQPFRRRYKDVPAKRAAGTHYALSLALCLAIERDLL